MANGFSFSASQFAEDESWLVNGPEWVENRAGVIVGRSAGKHKEAT